MPILDTVENSLKNFRPKTHRQFIVFSIASRFDDLGRLARYLNICDAHPKKVLIEAARLAEQHALTTGDSPAAKFFALLEDWSGKEAA